LPFIPRLFVPAFPARPQTLLVPVEAITNARAPRAFAESYARDHTKRTDDAFASRCSIAFPAAKRWPLRRQTPRPFARAGALRAGTGLLAERNVAEQTLPNKRRRTKRRQRQARLIRKGARAPAAAVVRAARRTGGRTRESLRSA
jgi:hypothetical protein